LQDAPLDSVFRWLDVIPRPLSSISSTALFQLCVIKRANYIADYRTQAWEISTGPTLVLENKPGRKFVFGNG
jgi:hypothetical protein